MNKIIIKMDTREKLPKKTHLLKYFQKHNIEVERIKLDVGDYCIKGKENVIIDLKQNIQELVQDMFCDATRFQLECAKAKNKNILLIFLIEEVFTKEQLLKWQSKTNSKGEPFVKVKGWQILKEMIKYVKLYDVKFKQCHKLAAGKMVLKLLKEETEKIGGKQ